MNRLRIVLLLNSAETFQNFVDIPTLINTLHRNGRFHLWSVFAAKGNRSIYIEKFVTPTELEIKLNEFAAKG